MVASDCQVDITVFVLLFRSRDWIHVIFSCNLQLDIGWLNSWIIDSFNVRVNVRALLLGSDYLYLLKKNNEKTAQIFPFRWRFPLKSETSLTRSLFCADERRISSFHALGPVWLSTKPKIQIYDVFHTQLYFYTIPRTIITARKQYITTQT